MRRTVVNRGDPLKLFIVRQWFLEVEQGRRPVFRRWASETARSFGDRGRRPPRGVGDARAGPRAEFDHRAHATSRLPGCAGVRGKTVAEPRPAQICAALGTERSSISRRMARRSRQKARTDRPPKERDEMGFGSCAGPSRLLSRIGRSRRVRRRARRAVLLSCGVRQRRCRTGVGRLVPLDVRSGCARKNGFGEIIPSPRHVPMHLPT